MIFLACPKQFRGTTSILQKRAISSWQALSGEVVLAGPASDVQDAPESDGISTRVVEGRPGISKLPLFSDLLSAADPGPGTLVCYLNADIILPDRLSHLREEGGLFYYGETRLPETFLITGSRWDLGEGIEWESTGSTDEITGFLVEAEPAGKVELHDESAMDFFVFPSGLFSEIAPLIVGRGGYDNALLAYCLRRRIPIIDSSREWPVLHQFHGYQHKKGGKKEVYLGDEAMFNRRNHQILRSLPNSLDADFLLEDGTLRQSTWRCGFWRRLELECRFRLGWKLLPDFFRVLQRCFRSHLRTSAKEVKLSRRAILSSAPR